MSITISYCEISQEAWADFSRTSVSEFESMGSTLVLASFLRTWVDVLVHGEPFLDSSSTPHELSLLEVPANLTYAARAVKAGTSYDWQFNLGDAGLRFRGSGADHVELELLQGRPLRSQAAVSLSAVDFTRAVDESVRHVLADISTHVPASHQVWLRGMWQEWGVLLSE